MKNTLFIITFLIVLTALILCLNPKLHKEISFYSVDFDFSNKKASTATQIPQPKQVKNTNLTLDTNIKTIENISNKELTQINNIDRDAYMNNIKMRYQQEQSKKLAEENAKKLSQKQVIKTPVKQTTPIKTQKPVTNAVKQQLQKPVQQKKTDVQKVIVQEKPKENIAEKKQEPIKKEKQLVTQQETIAWNKWRADIANSIGATTMATLKEKVEVGTKIKYSFDVDKNEQISNIVVSIIKGPINSGTQSAKSTIYKAIKSLNGKNILSFPNGTNRTSTTVVGAIELSDKTTKIDKNMFNDYETVTKQYYK